MAEVIRRLSSLVADQAIADDASADDDDLGAGWEVTHVLASFSAIVSALLRHVRLSVSLSL